MAKWIEPFAYVLLSLFQRHIDRNNTSSQSINALLAYREKESKNTHTKFIKLTCFQTYHVIQFDEDVII